MATDKALRARIETRINEGLKGQWYPVAKSVEIKDSKPYGTTLLGQKIVMWRDTKGEIKCIEDYCPHRGAPLSYGEIHEGNIGCRYHGVVVDGTGTVQRVPAMPDCAMEGRKALQDLVSACQTKEISLISDEIYHGIQYDSRAISALEISDDVYVVNSFSKYFSMTGWRIGWMVVPEDHVRTVERLAQNMFICPSHASQRLALHAMDCAPELDKNVDVYRANRALMLQELPKAGLGKFAPPDGAFYVYVDVSEYTDNSVNFCAEVLERADVAVTPGLDFDPVEGHKWVRMSYARSTEDIREGLQRLAVFMADLRAQA